MPLSLKLLVLSASFLLLLSPSASQAEVYKWVDKNGITHFTDDPDQLPEPMRSKALKQLRQKREKEKREREKARRRDNLPNETLPPSPERTPAPAPDRSENTSATPRTKHRKPTSSKSGTRTKLSKKLWAGRFEKARQLVKNLEAKCEKLQGESNSSGRTALIYARPDDRKKAGESRKTLETCKDNLAKARHYLKVELPEKARRAGVPPGWYR